MHGTTKISVLERLSLLGILLRLPFEVLSLVLFSSISKRFRKKRLNRIFVEAVTRFLVDRGSIRQIQWASGTSMNTYLKWAKKQHITPAVEELEGNAKLVWLTEKKTDRVLLYVHGGGFAIPATVNMFSFCARVQEEVLRRDSAKDFGVVALIYSLIPEKFPTQLSELTNALAHLLSSGLKPQNIILLGDSAGGNLIMQLMLHTLHPFDGIAMSPLSQADKSSSTESSCLPLGGLCLLSPWLSLNTPIPSSDEYDEYDVVPRQALLAWGSAYLSDVPEPHLPWIKPIICAPVSDEPWLAGLDKYVGRILITAGGKENLLDDSTGLYETLNKMPGSDLQVELDVEEDGIHEDPIFDVLAPQRDGGLLSDATMKIINWVAEGFGN